MMVARWSATQTPHHHTPSHARTHTRTRDVCSARAHPFRPLTKKITTALAHLHVSLAHTHSHKRTSALRDSNTTDGRRRATATGARRTTGTPAPVEHSNTVAQTRPVSSPRHRHQAPLLPFSLPSRTHGTCMHAALLLPSRCVRWRQATEHVRSTLSADATSLWLVLFVVCWLCHERLHQAVLVCVFAQIHTTARISHRTRLSRSTGNLPLPSMSRRQRASGSVCGVWAAV
jgi:hypothetical protein